MPGLNEIVSYELGIRLTQASILLSAYESAPDIEIEAALMRLESSASRASDKAEVDKLRLAQVANSCVDRWILSLSDRSDGEVCEELRCRLVTARQHHVEFLDQHHPGISRWFRLGLAIADGTDNTWSAGQPRIMLRDYPETLPNEDRLPYQRIVFINPVEPNWEWRDRDVIAELATELEQIEHHLFPKQVVLGGRECDIFTELDFKRFWGWHAIELGLAALAQGRVVPHWDRPTRTLYFAGQAIHAYRSSSGNQVRILEAFQNAGWQSSIESPIGNWTTINRTIADLNRNLFLGPIRFRGGVTGISWYIEPVTNG